MTILGLLAEKVEKNISILHTFLDETKNCLSFCLHLHMAMLAVSPSLTAGLSSHLLIFRRQSYILSALKDIEA